MAPGIVQRRDLLLLVLVLSGTALRLVGGFRYPGVEYDMDTFRIVGERLSTQPLHVYDTLRWPYGPVFLPFAAAAEALAGSGRAFDGLVKLPMTAADAVSTWLVADLLRRAGRRVWTQLTAAAMVALGPVPVLVVVAHGQIDPLAFCLVLAALWVWQRGGSSRALWCGVLLGLATATKTTPLFCLLALLPVCRDRQEALRLCLPAVALPLLLLLPWAVSEPRPLVTALTSNGGVPGFGSWSLLVQPSLADLWIDRRSVEASALTLQVTEHQNLVVLAAVLALAPLLWRRRLDPVLGTALVFLTVQAVNPNFSHQYLVWALLPALAAGLLRQAAAVGAAFGVTAWVLYLRPENALTAAGPYRTLALGAWLVVVAVTVQLLATARAQPAAGDVPVPVAADR